MTPGNAFRIVAGMEMDSKIPKLVRIHSRRQNNNRGWRKHSDNFTNLDHKPRDRLHEEVSSHVHRGCSLQLLCQETVGGREVKRIRFRTKIIPLIRNTNFSPSFRQQQLVEHKIALLLLSIHDFRYEFPFVFVQTLLISFGIGGSTRLPQLK
jgi:hypothetical protein